MFLVSRTDLSQKSGLLVSYIVYTERTRCLLVRTDCILGVLDPLSIATSLRETPFCFSSFSPQCHYTASLIFLPSSISFKHKHIRLHIFVRVLKYLYCIPLCLVELKHQRNPEFTIKYKTFSMFVLDLIS